MSQFVERKLHPVAFHSRKLNPVERNYEIHEKELLAIMEAFKEWRHYLLGTERPVTVYTDHQNLQHFLTMKKWSERKIRWPQALPEFNLKIVYRQGRKEGKQDEWRRWRDTRLRRE